MGKALEQKRDAAVMTYLQQQKQHAEAERDQAVAEAENLRPFQQKRKNMETLQKNTVKEVARLQAELKAEQLKAEKEAEILQRNITGAAASPNHGSELSLEDLPLCPMIGCSYAFLRE